MALIVAFIIPTFIYSQVRQDIFDFTSAERTELGNLIIDFVNPEIIRMHCDYTTIMNDNNYDIHDDFNFLTFHRAYIERLEDWLLEKGYSKYVPLPKWTGEVAPPNEFRFVGGTGLPPGNGVDPDCETVLACADAPDINPNIPSTFTACDPPFNWNATVNMPPYLKLPIVDGAGNDLCDWAMNPLVYTMVDDETGQNGLSRNIESPWHNSGHLNTGGVMLNFRSPSLQYFGYGMPQLMINGKSGNNIVLCNRLIQHYLLIYI